MISMIEHGIFSKSNCGEPGSSFMSKHVEVKFFLGVPMMIILRTGGRGLKL
jgi:hypothetical protein